MHLSTGQSRVVHMKIVGTVVDQLKIVAAFVLDGILTSDTVEDWPNRYLYWTNIVPDDAVGYGEDRQWQAAKQSGTWECSGFGGRYNTFTG